MHELCDVTQDEAYVLLRQYQYIAAQNNLNVWDCAHIKRDSEVVWTFDILSECQFQIQTVELFMVGNLSVSLFFNDFDDIFISAHNIATIDAGVKQYTQITV